VKDILYFESNNREVKIVTTEGEEIFYGKLNDVFKQVAKHHFMFIHKSYIINYFFVTKFTYEEVTMSNSEVLPISQSRRKSIREMQIRFEKEGVF
jgi:DNA-binding LytR/AlgR family response regulator